MENKKVSKYQEMKVELDNLKKQCHAYLSMAKNIREDNWKATKAYLNKNPEISKESICVETGCVLHEIREHYLDDFIACKNYKAWSNKRNTLKDFKGMAGIYWADPKIDTQYIDGQLQRNRFSAVGD